MLKRGSYDQTFEGFALFKTVTTYIGENRIIWAVGVNIMEKVVYTLK